VVFRLAEVTGAKQFRQTNDLRPAPPQRWCTIGIQQVSQKESTR
jgi:hypothetical protein